MSGGLKRDERQVKGSCFLPRERAPTIIDAVIGRRVSDRPLAPRGAFNFHPSHWLRSFRFDPFLHSVHRAPFFPSFFLHRPERVVRSVLQAASAKEVQELHPSEQAHAAGDVCRARGLLSRHPRSDDEIGGSGNARQVTFRDDSTSRLLDGNANERGARARWKIYPRKDFAIPRDESQTRKSTWVLRRDHKERERGECPKRARSSLFALVSFRSPRYVFRFFSTET